MIVAEWASQPPDMEARFGFDAAFLRDAVVARSAAASRSYAGGLYPRGASGIVRYLHSVANLREAMGSLGYEPDDTDQVARVVHTERQLAIVCAAGNSFTGLPFSLFRKDPTTKWPKGERTAIAVARNNQLALFDTPDDAQRRPLETWMLLQYADGEEVRAELSLPAGMNARGYITDWRERYLLPPLSNEGGVIDDPIVDGDDDGEAGIVINVEPR